MLRTPEVENLTKHGCSVLCLDCPEGMLFGIDYTAWAIGPRFMGIKLIPPGLHCIYCSASAEDVGIARTSFFLYMKPQDVHIFRWDPETEALVRLTNADEEARLMDGVRNFDFDSSLGPYPIELTVDWAELTRHISARLVSKIEPVSQTIHSKRTEYDAPLVDPQAQEEQPIVCFGDLDSDQELMDNDHIVKVQKPQVQQLPQLDNEHLESNLDGNNLFFSAMPRMRKKLGATPAETTQIHMDRSAQLDEMITREYNGQELGILGELQLAYIAFLLGQNYDAFEQWKALLQLLCSCEAAVMTRPQLFTELCRTFFAQLNQAPSDLFGADMTKDNFMGACALSLLDICDTDTAPPKLRKRCDKVRELVHNKFGITTEDLALLGEDAPVVVDNEGRDLIDISDTRLMNLD